MYTRLKSHTCMHRYVHTPTHTHIHTHTHTHTHTRAAYSHSNPREFTKFTIISKIIVCTITSYHVMSLPTIQCYMLFTKCPTPPHFRESCVVHAARAPLGSTTGLARSAPVDRGSPLHFRLLRRKLTVWYVIQHPFPPFVIGSCGCAYERSTQHNIELVLVSCFVVRHTKVIIALPLISATQGTATAAA